MPIASNCLLSISLRSILLLAVLAQSSAIVPAQDNQGYQAVCRYFDLCTWMGPRRFGPLSISEAHADMISHRQVNPNHSVQVVVIERDSDL